MLSVNPGIGSTRDAKLEVIVIFSKDDSNCFYKFCLNSSKARLFGKATKICAVVSKVDPVTTKPVDR